MAAAGQLPALDLRAGKEALDATLPLVLEHLGRSMGELGWRRPDPCTLLIPVHAVRAERPEEFLLRLTFRTSRAWPPSAQFVNPETWTYEVGADLAHLPDIRSPEVHVHPTYGDPNGRVMQLICCSATLEFYEVLHGVEPHHVWKDDDTFLTTVEAINRAIASHFHGRHGG